MDDATIRLILDLGTSGANVAQVRQELERLKTAASSVSDTYEVLAVSGHGYELVEQRLDNSVEALIDDLVREANALDQVERETIQTTAAKDKMARSSHALNSVIVQTGYAVQDFTSQIGTGGLGAALNAVANNLPIILVGLGVGGGLATVAAVATAAVGTLYSTSGKLVQLWQGGQTEEEAKAMEKLAQATKDANEQLVKSVEAVEGSEVTKRKSQFRQALIDYGGGGKLLDDLSKGNAQDRVFFANEIASGLKGDAGSGKLLGMQNAKFNQAFENVQSAEEIAADEKENERRVKARAKREANRKNNMMAQAQLEDEAGRDQEKDAVKDAKKADSDMAKRIANTRRLVGSPVVDDGKQAGKIETDIMRNNNQMTKLFARGLDVTGQTQQQIMELKQINDVLMGRLRVVEQNSLRLRDTNMGRPR